jgi:hypothetical protein
VGVFHAHIFDLEHPIILCIFASNQYKTMKINRTKDKVIYLLKRYPSLRDDDSKLIANYWNLELQAKGTNTAKGKMYELLQMIAAKELATPESIVRMRRKVQEDMTELRGVQYNRRHKEQKQVQQDLGYNTQSYAK